MVEMRVVGVKLDDRGHMVVILVDIEGKNFLPIWIGHQEAFSIELALHSFTPTRPITHDLLKNTIESLNAKVKKVAILSLKVNTFYAQITLESMGKEVNLDARPSDAIALALRAKVPIFASEAVFKELEQERGMDIERIIDEGLDKDEIIQ